MKYLILPLILLLMQGHNRPEEELVDKYMHAQAKVHGFNGNVLIARQDKIIYQASFGTTDYRTGRALTDTSVFELASVSKQFTAMAILLLERDGKLTLTDTLRKFFPELPYAGVSLRQMLTHTSGLPDYLMVMQKHWDRRKIAFNNDMIALLAKEKPALHFPPGTQWEYSNTAYAMLASIVEQRSGLSFAGFLQSRIFTPLGMRRTRIYNTRRSLKDTIADYAYGFTYAAQKKKYILPDEDPGMYMVVYLDGIQGDGVVNSTTGDLYRWVRALRTNRLLPESSQRAMLSTQELSDTLRRQGYGYGVSTGRNELDSFFMHSGGWPGYLTSLAHYPLTDLTLILLSNNESESSAISQSLAHICYGKPVELAVPQKAGNVDSSALKRLKGSYYRDGRLQFRLEYRSGSLFKVYPNGRMVRFSAADTANLFHSGGSDQRLQFLFDASGKISKAYTINYGIRSELQRTEPAGPVPPKK